jgi:protein-S-isoprenylcysteine O-methyltransferase Ste14
VVGLPVLAGLLMARRVGPDLPRALERRVPTAAAVVLALAGLAAFYWSMKRYTHGGFKKYGIFPIEWTPPGGWILWWLVYVLGLAALVAVVAVRRRDALWRPPPAA